MPAAITAPAFHLPPVTAALRWVRDDPRHALWLKLLLGLGFAMSFMPGGFNYASLDHAGSSAAEGGVLAQIQWLPLFGFGLLLVLLRWRLVWALLGRINPFLLLAMVWIFASLLWSNAPGITLKRAIKYLGVAFIAIGFFTQNWSLMGAIRALRTSAAVMIFASLLFIVLLPEYGVHQGYEEANLKGNWRGLAVHKNSFGALCVYSTLFWVHAWAARDLSLKRCLLPLLATLVCLVGCQSTTSLVMASFVALLLVYLLRMPKMFSGFSSFIILVSVLIVLFSLVVIWSGLPTPQELLVLLTGGIGKDASFTGRDVIWAAVLEQVKQRPWLGSGYSAFWLPDDFSGPSGEVLRQIKFVVNNSHNGYLEILNELGIVGVTLLAGFLSYQFAQLHRLMQWNRAVASFGMVFMVYEVFLNISEAYFWRTTSTPALMEWIVAVMTARTLMHYQWLAQLVPLNFTARTAS